MGLSSSQARLLTLTARQHDIEYKAAKIEAMKLQMANDSAKVYEEYLNALNATNVQIGMLTVNGSNSYINANLYMLEGNSDYNITKTLFLKDAESDKLYVSPEMAEKYNLDGSGVVGDVTTFMNNAGFTAIVPGFNVIENTLGVTSYSPVTSTVNNSVTREVPNINPTAGYQAVSPKAVPADAIAVSSVTGDFDASKTYVINTKDDLVALQNLTNSGKNTAGVNFILGADIDMSGVNWTGIGSTESNAFKGNLDGNGYTISNLTSSSASLFKHVKGNQTSVTDSATGVTTTATQGVIKNVVLTNLKVTASGDEIGGLIGKSQSAYVENCFTQGTISGRSWMGGLIGHNIKSSVQNSTANVGVSATGNCIGGLIGHDTNGVIQNTVSMGAVKANNGSVGGFIGHETSSGSTFIYECTTISSTTGGNNGAFIGLIDSGCSATVIKSQYSSAINSTPVGSGANSLTSQGNGDSLTSGATRTVTTNNVNIPSKESVVSNISMMLDKAGVETDAAFDNNLNTWLNNFYKVDPNYSDGALVKDSLKLASINEHIANYLNGAEDSAIVNSIIADINANSLTNTKAFQDKFVETKDYEFSPYAASGTALASKNTPITIPSVTNIANNIYTALKEAGYADLSSPDDVQTVLNWTAANVSVSSDADKLYAANLNAYITDFINGTNTDATELNKIYNAIKNNSAYTMSASAQKYSANEYSVNAVVNQDQSTTFEWDMNNQDIVDALNYYELIKNGYILVTEEQAHSNVWLTNMVNSGTTVLVETKKKEILSFETSLSTNTSLQEVSDETKLRKAEAKYEADMKKIDMKDRKYDTDLAALDTERNALKQEIETLKTVAKDNVERTFKLFS